MGRDAAPVQLELAQRFPVPAEDGFAYITDPRHWPEFWPRLVRIVDAGRWREPGDRAALVLRLAGREVELQMTLVRFEPPRLVEYTSTQRGLPAARHWRHFEPIGDELHYRIAVEYTPRGGWRRAFDQVIVRRAIARSMRETLANLDRRFREQASAR
ncbi:MAG: SRPBCC family protein [Solirubrobacteraceae bacterium]